MFFFKFITLKTKYILLKVIATKIIIWIHAWKLLRKNSLVPKQDHLDFARE